MFLSTPLHIINARTSQSGIEQWAALCDGGMLATVYIEGKSPYHFSSEWLDLPTWFAEDFAILVPPESRIDFIPELFFVNGAYIFTYKNFVCDRDGWGQRWDLHLYAVGKIGRDCHVPRGERVDFTTSGKRLRQ